MILEAFLITIDWLVVVARGLFYTMAWLSLIVIVMTLGEYQSGGSGH